MECPQCHSLNPDKSKFCSECGVAITIAKESGAESLANNFEVTTGWPESWRHRYRILNAVTPESEYKVYDMLSDRLVILDIFPWNQDLHQRFLALAAIDHPNIFWVGEIELIESQLFVDFQTEKRSNP